MFTQRRARRALRTRVLAVLVGALLATQLATPVMATPLPSPAALTSVAPSMLAATSSTTIPMWKRTRAAAEYARRQVGKPYRWGASGPNAFDCSGLTLASWARGGKYLPHSSRLQAKRTRRIKWGNKKRGDLFFYGNPVHHVTMYLGNGKMIEAPRPGLRVRIVSAKRPGRVKIGRP
jgi:cell wall-associated NlpC family hydrolase